MADTEQTEQEPRVVEEQAARPEAEAPKAAESKPQTDRPQNDRPAQAQRREGGPGPQGQRREGGRPPGDRPQAGDRPQGNREGGGNREGRGPHGGREGGRGERGDDRRGGERGRFEGPPEIDIEKLISDPLYLDNQAHGVVSRMRDMDSGTKSQLRRLYNAVRRAVRAPENERQQQFVMLRARLAYTIARHSLRSLDSLEKLLLQVTRKNDARGYERFRDLFEAIVAYNE
ncbi:MAG: type III-A CRISPR-associated protein Csm2 [Bryobacteraceae bacterium]